MVKTIREIIVHPYARDDDNFVKDCIDFFTENNIAKKLSKVDVDDFMTKITKDILEPDRHQDIIEKVTDARQ